MKVGIEELKAIKPGTKKVFKAEHPRELQNIRAMASYVHNTYPEWGLRFTTHICRPKMEITIEAISVERTN